MARVEHGQVDDHAAQKATLVETKEKSSGDEALIALYESCKAC
jgi:hypothetical protein